jgi:hypothetical protein
MGDDVHIYLAGLRPFVLFLCLKIFVLWYRPPHVVDFYLSDDGVSIVRLLSIGSGVLVFVSR